MRATLTDWDLTRDGTPQFEGAEVGGRYSATSWLRIAPPEQVDRTRSVGDRPLQRHGSRSGRAGRLSHRHPLRVRGGVGRDRSRRSVSSRSRAGSRRSSTSTPGAAPAMTELVDVRVRPANDRRRHRRHGEELRPPHGPNQGHARAVRRGRRRRARSGGARRAAAARERARSRGARRASRPRRRSRRDSIARS